MEIKVVMVLPAEAVALAVAVRAAFPLAFCGKAPRRRRLIRQRRHR
jgi:hypothetical protein